MEEMLSTDAGMLGFGLGAIAATGLIIQIVWAIFRLIAAYKIVGKMGEPGWKSLIPIYHDYILFKHVWSGKMGIIYVVVSIVASFAGNSESIALQLISIVLYIVAIVYQAKFANRLSKAFGHGTGYAVGIFFLEPIFTLILGFGSDQYLGNPSEQTFA